MLEKDYAIPANPCICWVFGFILIIAYGEFIEKVIVHEAVKINGKRTMQVDIHLNFIGKFELPIEAEEPPQKIIGSRGRKLRKDMTPEELEHERNIDRRAYAKKKAARLAKEEAERAKILAGTSFENIASPKATSRSTPIAV